MFINQGQVSMTPADGICPMCEDTDVWRNTTLKSGRFLTWLHCADCGHRSIGTLHNNQRHAEAITWDYPEDLDKSLWDQWVEYRDSRDLKRMLVAYDQLDDEQKQRAHREAEDERERVIRELAGEQ